MSQYKYRKSDEKFHYLIAGIALVSGLLHFFVKWEFYHHHGYLTSGLWFATITPILYAIFAFSLYKATREEDR